MFVSSNRWQFTTLVFPHDISWFFVPQINPSAGLPFLAAERSLKGFS
jgi:hypothetical protein